MWAAILNIILGLWVMASPAVLTLQAPLSSSQYITGPLIVTFSIIAVSDLNRGVRRLNLLFGLWLICSVFIFESPTQMTALLIGATGMAVAALSFFTGKTKGNYGGGWRSLF